MPSFRAISGPAITYQRLVDALAETSHKTWMKQAVREGKETNPSDVITNHDRERAVDAVDTLFALGLLHRAD
jgi:hypothetical protein